MIVRFIRDGVEMDPRVGFQMERSFVTDEGESYTDLVSFPPNWLTLAEDTELAELGIQKVEEEWAPTADDVNAERDRRIMMTKSVALPTGKSFTVDMDRGGRQNVSDLGNVAQAKKSMGITTPVSFRDADNQDHDLSNDEVIMMGLQIASQVQDIHLAARELKRRLAEGERLDVTDDAYWS